MLDPKLLREHSAQVAKIYQERLFDQEAYMTMQKVIVLDERRRQNLFAAEELKQQRNQASQVIAQEKDAEKRKALIEKMDAVKRQVVLLDAELRQIEEELEKLSLQLPNLPDEEVPLGHSDSENKVVREEGKKRPFSFSPKTHWELGESLGILDFERGVKISGSRFYVLKGAGAALQRALIQWMIDVHIEQGYTEVMPPYMVRQLCLYGTAQLPKFGDNLYRDAEEDFYFIPTAEVPVTNLYRDEILKEEELPINHVAYTACFRREKLAAGKDTRGIKRGHQFDKVEMVKFVKPEESKRELKVLLSNAEEILKRLELPYRVIQMCTADLSFAACEKYDLEVFSPGVNEWLEVSSCSNFGDFQARRAQIKYRSPGEKPRFVHTLNGSGLALPRTVIAVLETYQQPDGSVQIPKVLRPYLHGKEVIEPSKAR